MKNQTIKTGDTLQAVSICDSNCIFTAKVVERKKNFATLLMDGRTFRKKIIIGYDGTEYIYALGNYSMSPAFHSVN